MNKLYIVRHGKTIWNEMNLLQGLTDIELSKEGIKQVKELKNKLDISKIDICLSSPLKRAKKTATLITNNQIPIIYDDLLLERNYGELEGKSIDFDLIKKEWDYKINDKRFNIEPIQTCLNRAKKFLNKINIEYPNKTILIVSHGSFIKAIHFNIIGYNQETDFLSFSPQNTTVYEYNIN